MSSVFLYSGIREVDFSFDDETISFLKSEWKIKVSTIEDYPEKKFHGKGIVMCAGGISYFTASWVAIKNLRLLGCELPIELWYLGHELSTDVIEKLGKHNVKCKNFYHHTNLTLSGVMLKPLAIICSEFKEILFLDADNNCLTDPSYLFEMPGYKQTGAVFWPDYWITASDNPIWQIVENDDYSLPEQESGQILINKEKNWKELNLCLFFNERNKVYYQMLYGDKDTFKFAWLALKTEFYMMPFPVSLCGFKTDSDEFIGNTIVQHDSEGRILFLHRNLIKWDITENGESIWQTIKKFTPEAESRKYYLKGYAMDLGGDCEENAVVSEISILEQRCLGILASLRQSDFYTQFLIYCHINALRDYKSRKKAPIS